MANLEPEAAARSQSARPEDVNTETTHVKVTDPFDAAADPDMPLVVRALDPGEINYHFEKIRFHDATDADRPRLHEIKVVRHKPGRRCLIEYVFSKNGTAGNEAPVVLIGKLRARGPDDTSYRLSQALVTSGFHSDCEDGISIPVPLGIVPELHMWFQQKVPGRLATDLLAGAGGEAVAKRIAEAAHKIHTTDIRPQRHHTMADELRILHDRLNLLGGREPAWEARLSRVRDACDRLGAAVPEPDIRPIHRDFYADQVMVDGGRLHLLDFDLCCLGDPALDIGNFTAHLKEYALRTMGNPEALATQETALVERFVELAGPETRASIDAYVTLTLARHIYISTLFPDRRAFTSRILELCEQRLRIAPAVRA